MRHLIDPTDLTVAETEQIVALAEDIIANRAKYSEACRGKKLATLFYEPSTRTRLSFTAAMLELGGQRHRLLGRQLVVGVEGRDGGRHRARDPLLRGASSPCATSRRGRRWWPRSTPGVPVINAGDGSHSPSRRRR